MTDNELMHMFDACKGEPVAWIEHHKGGNNLVWEKTKLPCSPLYPAIAPATEAAAEEPTPRTDTTFLSSRLRYMGKQYQSGQQARGGTPLRKHYLEEAADALDRLERELTVANAELSRLRKEQEGKVLVLLPEVIGPISEITEKVCEIGLDFEGCETDQEAVAQVLNAIKALAAAKEQP